MCQGLDHTLCELVSAMPYGPAFQVPFRQLLACGGSPFLRCTLGLQHVPCTLSPVMALICIVRVTDDAGQLAVVAVPAANVAEFPMISSDQCAPVHRGLCATGGFS